VVSFHLRAKKKREEKGEREGGRRKVELTLSGDTTQSRNFRTA